MGDRDPGVGRRRRSPPSRPGTISKAIPAARSAQRLLAAAAEHERVAALQPHDRPARPGRARAAAPRSRSCGTASPPPSLPTNTSSASARAPSSAPGPDQPVIQDHVGRRDQLERAGASAARDRRARADQVDPPRRRRPQAASCTPAAISRARRSSSSAPTARRRAATASAERLRRLGRRRTSSSAAQAEPSGSPTHARSCSARPRALGVGAERRVAVGVERASERPLGAQRGQRRRVGDALGGRAARRSSSARPSQRERALPGGGNEARRVEQRARPRARGPSRCRPARASTIASSPSLGGELGEPRVDVAAQRHDLEVGAGAAQLRDAPQAARADARARRPARSSAGGAAEHVLGAGARGGAEQRQSLGAGRRARPWPSARRGRSRPSSSACSSSSTQRDLSAAPAPASPPVDDRDDLHVAEHRRDQLRLRQRERAAAGSDPHQPATPGVARASTCAGRARSGGARGRGPRPARPPLARGALALRSASSRRPNSSRTSSRLRVAAGAAAIVLEAAQADRRLVQQPRHHGAGDRLDAREVARRGALPAPGVLGQHLLDDRRCRARAAPLIVGSASSWPSQRAKRWISSSTISCARGTSSARE